MIHVQVATLEAAVTYLQQLLPGQAMTRGRAYRDPELLRTISMERTRSGAAFDWHASCSPPHTRVSAPLTQPCTQGMFRGHGRCSGMLHSSMLSYHLCL